MTTLVTNSQFKQFDLNGEPLAAGKIYTYEVGTTTPKTTYEDADMSSEHENPIILDSFGEATIYINGDTKFVVTDSADAQIRTYPLIEDTLGTLVDPVLPSPDGAVYRSDETETGYIKVRLPMSDWPNTKMSMTILVYEDVSDSTITIKAAGYASSIASSWSNCTAKTDGSADISVQFGNDGTYPAIYIGAIDSEWTKPQIAVVNFFAGNYSYDSSTWNSGWNISITTTLGTITASKTAVSLADDISDNTTAISTINDNLGWEDWQTATLMTGWSGSGFSYRKTKDGKLLQITGDAQQLSSTSNTQIFTLPSGYRPTKSNTIPVYVNSTPLYFQPLYISGGGIVSINSLSSTGDIVHIDRITGLS